MNDLRYESNEESLVNNYELIRKKGNLREPRLQLQGRKEPTGCNLGSYGSQEKSSAAHTQWPPDLSSSPTRSACSLYSKSTRPPLPGLFFPLEHLSYYPLPALCCRQLAHSYEGGPN